MAIITPTLDIPDLGVMTAFAPGGAGDHPIPVPDQFAPSETRARRFERDVDNLMFRMPAAVTSVNGRFSFSIRLRMTGNTTSGIAISQFINSSPTFTGGFAMLLSGSRFLVVCNDTSNTGNVDKLTSFTNSTTSILDRTGWFTLQAVVDALTTNSETIKIYLNGIDVINTVGYLQDSVVGGAGVTAFAGNPNEFTLGNYDQNSASPNGPDYDIGQVKVWDDILLTDQDVLDDYKNDQSNLPRNPSGRLITVLSTPY